MQLRGIKIIIPALLLAASASLSAAPVGYSINSDSGTVSHDGLYRIDLATGAELERIGTVQSLLTTRLDVEGLAFAADGTLYGVDDESMQLFPIDTANAVIDHTREVDIEGLPTGDNDFGMTFGCDGELYVASVARKSLYRMALTGETTLIGSEGSLGVKISALAAYGNPVRLYGLSNGTAGESEISSPSLYQIDVGTGVATLIGALGPGVGEYAEGGLAFDEAGQLWSITDRRPALMPSQVMRINTSTGAASEIRNTTEEGFESLAIAPPGGCGGSGGESATFTVQKRFSDNNDVTPVDLHISCNTGLPLEQSLTVLPDEGDFGSYEVKFVVTDFIDGTLNCEVWEDAPAGYTPEYDCQSANDCSTSLGVGPCLFEGVGNGQDNLCLIQNRVAPVPVHVTKQWLYTEDEIALDEDAIIELVCDDLFDGDGTWQSDGSMAWYWPFEGDGDFNTATVYPDFAGATSCRTDELVTASSVESESSCENGIPVNVGDSERHCVVTNTVFLEGIPTLSPVGLLLAAALMLMTGLVAARRF